MAFIGISSAGTWAPYEPGIWAPLLISPGDVVRNVASYIPFGIFGLFALRRSDLRGAMRVIAIALLFSIANEALQLYTNDRVASVTDVISAGAGTLIGVGIVVWLGPK
jgi:VanZ family protein